jgi:hypothetical protein
MNTVKTASKCGDEIVNIAMRISDYRRDFDWWIDLFDT